MTQVYAKAVIGIDIGTDALKAVLVSQEGDGFQCLGTMVKPLLRGTDADGSLFEGIKEVHAKFGRYSKKAVLVVPERMVQYKFLDKPLMTDDQLRQVIDNEMKTTLPSAKSSIATFENDKIDYLYASLGQITSGTVSKNHLMSVFASLSNMNGYAELFKKAGLTLEGVFTAPQVIHEFLAASYASEFEATPRQVAVINLGATANYLTISRDKILSLGRPFPLAGDDITKELAGIDVSASQATALKTSDAENYKKVIGILSPEEMSGYEQGCIEIKVSQRIRGLIGQTMQKIRLALEYIKTQEGIPVAKIFLAGGGAAMRGILEQAKEVFGHDEIVVTDPFNSILLSPAEPEYAEIPPEHLPLFIPALGACICAIKPQPQTIDLLEIVRKERNLIRLQFMQKYVPTVAIIVTGIIALGLYYQFWYKDYVVTQAKLASSLLAAEELYKPMANVKTRFRNVISKEMRTLEGKMNFVNTLLATRVKWSKFFIEVGKLIPGDVWFKSLKAVRVGPAIVQVTMDGKSTSLTLVTQFQQSLQDSGLFYKNQIDWQGSKNAGVGTVFGFTFVGVLATDSASPQ